MLSFTPAAAVAIDAMKAFALGRRSKWKDCVDLYFIFNRSAKKVQLADSTAGAISLGRPGLARLEKRVGFVT